MTNITIEKIPIIVGVTGHRDLCGDEAEILSQKIRDVFQLLRKAYPDTPLLLLTPLAEGADRLAAKVALSEQIDYIAPLPLPKEEYLKDFPTQALKDEFYTLLEKAKGHFELPILEGNTRENIADYGFHRDRQYALVGAYIARHCHILIALWDGKVLDKVGGTSQVVRFRLEGDMKDLPDKYKTPINPLDLPDIGPVYHIKASRESGIKLSPLEKGYITIQYPGQPEQHELKSLLSESLKLLNTFNQDVKNHSHRLSKEILDSQEHLVPEEIQQRLSPPFRKMLAVYGEANILARYFQDRTRSAMKRILGMSLLMVLSYGLYSAWKIPFCIGIYFISFLLACWQFTRVEKQAYPSKSLDFRALAEGLRVQIFWLLGGLDNDGTAEYYLRKHRGELDWIRRGIRALCVHNWVNDRQSIALVKQHWVEHQKDYFEKAARDNQDWLYSKKKWADRLFCAGLIAAGLLLGSSISGQLAGFSAFFQKSPVLHDIVIILIGFLPALGAVLRAYAQKRGYDAHAKQYAYMAGLFKRAWDELEKYKNDETNSREILRELGKAALEENSEWVLLHRERTLEIPKG